MVITFTQIILLHPMKLPRNIELSIAPEVTAELNHWSDKLGI
jgi:hypothetical protein